MDEEIVQGVIIEEATKKAQSLCKVPESWEDTVRFYLFLVYLLFIIYFFFTQYYL